MPASINLADHPGNTDRTARLTQSTVPMRCVGREVYQMRAGFVACLPDGQCLPGFFTTEADAKAAQDAWFAMQRALVI